MPKARACTVCGCTENFACEQGCEWVQLEPVPLCSECLRRMAEVLRLIRNGKVKWGSKRGGRRS